MEMLRHQTQIENEADQRAFQWQKFFSEMTDEQVFEYLEKEKKAVERAKKHQKRMNAALVHIRNKNLTNKYLDWKRNG